MNAPVTRSWWAVSDPLDPVRGSEVLGDLLDVLADRVGFAIVDAYTDHRDALSGSARLAEQELRVLGARRLGGRRGDPGMGVELDLADPVHAALLRDYGAWSIHAELLDADRADVGTWHDCGLSIVLLLDDDERARVVAAVGADVTLEPLARRTRRRSAGALLRDFWRQRRS